MRSQVTGFQFYIDEDTMAGDGSYGNPIRSLGGTPDLSAVVGGVAFVATVPGPGGSNNCRTTFQVLDGNGNPYAGRAAFSYWWNNAGALANPSAPNVQLVTALNPTAGSLGESADPNDAKVWSGVSDADGSIDIFTQFSAPSAGTINIAVAGGAIEGAAFFF